MMSDFMVWDADDFGVDHVITDQCRSHDCRDKLDEFHYANNNFKATLFAIPGEMTKELADWCLANKNWIELAVHGFFHSGNYECSQMTSEEFAANVDQLQPMLDEYFVKGFKAPGWQISDGCYEWLQANGWWLADQDYNDRRRPGNMQVYINNSGNFGYFDKQPTYDDVYRVPVTGKHYHTWDVGTVGNAPNGVYEASDEIIQSIKDVPSFKFISELF
jgi:hypothetical protein